MWRVIQEGVWQREDRPCHSVTQTIRFTKTAFSLHSAIFVVVSTFHLMKYPSLSLICQNAPTATLWRRIKIGTYWHLVNSTFSRFWIFVSWLPELSSPLLYGASAKPEFMPTDRCSFTLATWRGHTIIIPNYGRGKRLFPGSVHGLAAPERTSQTPKIQYCSTILACERNKWITLSPFASAVAAWLKTSTAGWHLILNEMLHIVLHLFLVSWC